MKIYIRPKTVTLKFWLPNSFLKTTLKFIVNNNEDEFNYIGKEECLKLIDCVVPLLKSYKGLTLFELESEDTYVKVVI